MGPIAWPGALVGVRLAWLWSKEARQGRSQGAPKGTGPYVQPT